MGQTYNIEIKEQDENNVRFQIERGNRYLKFNEVFELWKTSSEFVKFYKDGLMKFGYDAFYWEHPAIQLDYLENSYECVLQNSRPLIKMKINEKAFEKFINIDADVVDFMNLGKNARLIVPTKRVDLEIYNHFGKFIKFADEKQIIEFFKRVGELMLKETENRKLLWLSTAGLGVAWLHIRMDEKPKYYKTKIYKDPDYLS